MGGGAVVTVMFVLACFFAFLLLVHFFKVAFRCFVISLYLYLLLSFYISEDAAFTNESCRPGARRKGWSGSGGVVTVMSSFLHFCFLFVFFCNVLLCWLSFVFLLFIIFSYSLVVFWAFVCLFFALTTFSFFTSCLSLCFFVCLSLLSVFLIMVLVFFHRLLISSSSGGR